MKTIYLAGGCFWGLQKFVDGAKGVCHTEVGYANGRKDNPTYEQVRSQTTGYAETVKIEFDDSVLTVSALITRFLQVINPFSVNKQGEDEGEQYRTGIYYVDEEDGRTAKNLIADLEQTSSQKCAVEVCPLVNFWRAEEYHQKYLEKNPSGYCHIFASF